MGVKGLETYVEKYCPETCVRVNLKNLAQEYKRQHGKKPVLVVDGLSLLRDFYHGGMSWVYGGQWNEYLQSLKNFVQKFKSAGIQVVFIFDGVVEKSKRPVWIVRRKREMQVVRKIFQHVKTFGTEPKRNLVHLPPGAGMFAGLGLKSLGVPVYHSLVEADREIAEFVLSRDCFGILSQDSDFLIYDTGPVSYFSARSLKKSKLTTVKYCVDALCEHLGLERSDLPLLSCLLGNDVISSEKLKYFHARVATGSQLIPALAQFINDLPSDITVPEIARRIFSSPNCIQLFVQGIQSYILPGQSSKWPMPESMLTINAPILEAQEPLEKADKQGKNSKCTVRHVRPTVEDKILQEAKRRHQNTQNIKAIYEILTAAEGDSGALLEDEDSGIPPSTFLYRPIRKRLYGVVYGVGVHPVTRTAPGVDQCSQQMASLVIGGDLHQSEEVVVGLNATKEWFVYPGCKLRQADIVLAKPLGIPGGTPSLKDLWFGRGPETVALRWKAFIAGMGCSIPPDRLQSIHDNLKVLVVVVHYMVKQCVLETWEVNAFLIQALLYTDWYKHRRNKVPVDCRAVQLAALFMKGVAAAVGTNCACGWPLSMDSCLPWWYFDGKFFHHVYLQCKSGKGAWDLCKRNDQTWQLFQFLRDCVLCEVPSELGRLSAEEGCRGQSKSPTSFVRADSVRPVESTRTASTRESQSVRPKNPSISFVQPVDITTVYVEASRSTFVRSQGGARPKTNN